MAEGWRKHLEAWEGFCAVPDGTANSMTSVSLFFNTLRDAAKQAEWTLVAPERPEQPSSTSAPAR
jgi:hypothetical protein